MCLLSEDPRQYPHDGPAEEATVGCRVAAVKERVLFLRVAVNVAVDPDVSFFVLSKRFEQLFQVKHFGVELQVWRDPLSVQVHSGNRVAIVATDDTVRIEHGDQHKGVELAQKLRLASV